MEARALNKALNRVAVTRFGHDIRQLLLVDSMSVALSFDRCRSQSFKLLRQIRKFAAVCLARNIDPHVRWIPSELNSADEPSRTDGAEPSKTLVDQIPIVNAPVKAAENVGGPRVREGHGIQEVAGSSPGSAHRKSSCTKADTLPPEEFSPEKARDPTSSNAFSGFDHSEVGDKETEPSEVSPSFFRKFKLIDGPSGQEEREEFGRPEQAPSQEVCRRGHGSNRSGPFLAGKEGDWEGCRSILHDRVQSVPVLRLDECLEFTEPFVGGCSNDQVHELPVLAGAPITSWGQVDGSLYAPSPGIQPIWVQPSSTLLSGVERLEEAGSRVVSESLPVGSLVSHCCGNGASEFSSYGPLHYDLPFSLHSAKRTLQVQDILVGAAHSTGDRTLGPSPQSGGISGALKDRGVRRQHPVRLSLFEALGLSSLPGVKQAASCTAPMGLRLSPLLPGIRQHRQKVGDRDNPVQHEAFGPLNRQKPEYKAVVGGAEKRTLEESQKRHSIREVGSPCCKFQSAPPQSPTSLPSRRVTFRGCDAGPYQAPSASLKRGNRPGMYVADLFAGKGGVAHQCRRLGYKAKEWELERGVQFDLTNRKVRRKLIRDVKKGRVLAAMLAPPCTTFSVARDRTKVIRSREHPWGLPSDQLTSAELEKVLEGNRCFEAAFELIHLFNKHQVPWLLENPATSKCWYLPPIHDLLNNQGSCSITLDFCQFGTPWRKRTTFLAGQLDMQDLARLQRHCRGSHGYCSRTKAKHWQLTGTHKGVCWTKIAQPYPSNLCRQIAFVLTAPSHYNQL